jgi:arginine repressor
MKIDKIEKVVKYLESHTWRKTAEFFKISEMTISRYLKKFNQVNVINNDKLINELKHGFNKLIRKDLFNMKASELRIVYHLLTQKNVSLRKEQYIVKIKNLIGKIRWTKL